MKFLCEHCKAKYQIADDKVAGRTVRMKCRKCGGSIEVRAEVTETSVATKAPEVGGVHAGAPKPPPAKPAPPKPAPAPTGAAPRAGQPPRPAGPGTGPGSGSKDSPLAGAFQRNVHHDEASPGLDLRELSASDEWYVAVNGVPVGPVRVDEVRRKAAIGAVTEESLCWQEGMEEWRAIRTVTELAALVREAAAGGRASLLPDQRVSAPPGAPRRPSAPMVSAVKPSGPPPRRDSARGPLPPAAPKRPTAAVGPLLQAGGAADDDGAPTLIGRSPLLDGMPPSEPVDASHGAAGTNGSGPNGAGTNGAGGMAAADPFRQQAADPFKPVNGFPGGAAVHGGPAGVGGNFFPGAAAPPVVSPFSPYGGALPGDPAAAQLAAPAQLPPIVVTQPRRVSPIAVGVVVMFACFGLMSAYMLLSKQERQVVVAVPAPVAQVPTAVPTPTPLPTDIPLPVAAAPSASAAAVVDAGAQVVAAAPRGGTGPAGGNGGRPNAKVPTGAAADPSLRALLESSGTGPNPTSGGGGGGGGAQLGEEDTQRVVSSHSLGVKRTCWDRSSSTTSSVTETVHIVISGSGSVSSATATGNDPVVGHCLEEEIKRWHWPGGGEVNVPFHFLRQ